MDLSGFPYAPVEFTARGAVAVPDQADAAVRLAADAQATDLFVFVHGWNNDMPSATELYTAWADSFNSMLPQVPGFAGRRAAIVGVLWPSIAFDDASLIPGGQRPGGQRPGGQSPGGGGQGLGTPLPPPPGAGPGPVSPDMAQLAAQLDSLQAVFTSPQATQTLAQARDLVPRLGDSPDVRRRFADLVRSLLPAQAADDTDVDGSERFLTVDGDELFHRLAPAPLPQGNGPDAPSPGPGTGGAADEGGAAGLGDIVHDVTGAVRHGVDAVVDAGRTVLNLTTFYEMKARAGTVGATGVATLLGAIRAAHPELRLHLVGHSFGARLATAAVCGTSAALPVRSLSLLQGAFSHFGFSHDWDGTHDGAFRSLVVNRRVTGPVMITHTANDKAVGLAYALASRLADEVAVGLVGGPQDVFGGLGANGALATPESVWATMLDVGGTYQPSPGQLLNLCADAYVHGHTDVRGPQVAYAVLTAASA